MHARVLIADDHAAVLAGLSARLEAAHYLVVGAVRSSDEVMHALATTDTDALITDLVMPGSDGIAYLTELINRYPGLPIVVLTMLRRPVVLQSVYRLGTISLVDKAASLDEVVQALRRAISKKRYVSKSLLELMGTMDLDQPTQSAALSPREQQILRLLGEGKSVAQIALAMGTSPNTVSMQKSNMMRKLGMRNDIDLFDYLNLNSDTGTSP